jgi:predicted O-methyltransferase YrrM
MPIYSKYIKELNKHIEKQNESRFVSNQLLLMREEVIKRRSPIIVELGVDKGQSTKVFLNSICNKKNGKLISIDIKDCSNNLISHKNWVFIKQDSTNIKSILKKQPIIKKGIDILYVDSLHTEEHVKKEIFGYFKYLKQNGVIFIDDVDSDPYMKNQRKNSVSIEINNRKIFNLINAIFRSNINNIDLVHYRGSTGLIKLIKKNKLYETLKPPLFIKERKNKIFWIIFEKIFFRKPYNHNENNNSSFLINPNSKDYE